jgi:cytochrome c oxidase assembly factor CtaG
MGEHGHYGWSGYRSKLYLSRRARQRMRGRKSVDQDKVFYWVLGLASVSTAFLFIAICLTD